MGGKPLMFAPGQHRARTPETPPQMSRTRRFWTRLAAWLRQPEPAAPDVLLPRPVPYHIPDRDGDYDDGKTYLDLLRVAPYLAHPRRGPKSGW
jgi:hypothetical protein